MTRQLTRRISRFVHKKPRPANGTQFRNRVNQAAHRYETSERMVHSALFTHETNMRTEWVPEQVTPHRV